MGLSSAFQTLRLAVGPSLVYTAGALTTGRYFREVLLGVPFHPDNRIMIELLGDFAKMGKIYQSGMAIICGLGGYHPGESRIPMGRFIETIRKEGGIQLMTKTWPVSERSDLIYNLKSDDIKQPNTIRFHVVSGDNKIILQSEYSVSEKGLVYGPGSRDAELMTDLDQYDSLEDVIAVCEAQQISLVDYIYQSEEILHSISRIQSHERMQHTWEIMESTIHNGITNHGLLPGNQKRLASDLYDRFKSISAESELPGKEVGLAGIYAAAVSEEALGYQLVITAPSCETAGVLPAVLKVMQRRFRIAADKMEDALMIAGFVGSMLRKQASHVKQKNVLRLDFQIASAMASASATYLITESMESIKNAIASAILLSDSNPTYATDRLTAMNMKHAQMSFSALNLAVLGFAPKHEKIDQVLKQTNENQA